jgi:hypothetical protein
MKSKQEEIDKFLTFGVAFSYVVLFYLPPWCFLSMFIFKFCEFCWQLFCFKNAAASRSYFTVIFIFDFEHQ